MPPDGAGALVVVGAGAAGVELAFAARQSGWQGPVDLIGDELPLPYHRPPLSKACLGAHQGADPGPAGLALRPRAAYDAAGITIHLGRRVRRIDRLAGMLALEDGGVIPYARLALCTGGRPRRLPVPGADEAANLHYLRTHDDAEAIRGRLRPGARLVVVGGGYVGLEIAASARKAGAEVTVLEAQARLLARVASAEISAFFARVHAGKGVAVRTGAAVSRIVHDAAGFACGVEADGTTLPADAVVVGVGMLPNMELAQAAGLEVDGGIVVNALSATSDPAIFAAGDCTVFDSALYGRRVRLESVPNALEQARAAASSLCGRPKPNCAVPWFWSDQYDFKLQMAGLHEGYDQTVARGDLAGGNFTLFHLRKGRALAATSVNRPGEFMWAKRIVAEGRPVDAAKLADESVPLKASATAQAMSAP